MTQYKTVDITTLKGLQQAERLQAKGWTIVRPGMFTVIMRNR